MASRKRQHLGRREEVAGLFKRPDSGWERAVLATLAFADASGYPLTAAGVFERLISPVRVGAAGHPSLGDVVGTLDALSSRGAVREHHGWYAPTGTMHDAFVRHLDRLNIQAEKWRRMRRYAWWFQAVPFVRAVFASGSLAQGRTGPDSDWDMFVVVRRNRLYTARTALMAVAWLMGRLRTKRDRIAPDRFCFNHYVTDDGLTLRHRSLFVAGALAGLVPVLDPDGLILILRQANRWVGEYLASWPPPEPISVVRTVRPSRFLRGIGRVAEIVLARAPGDWLERLLCGWQQRRIGNEPATHAKGGRVTADERELEFHPHSAERAVLARYNAAMTGLGMPAGERDSGLK